MLREQLACAKSKGEETVGRNLQVTALIDGLIMSLNKRKAYGLIREGSVGAVCRPTIRRFLSPC